MSPLSFFRRHLSLMRALQNAFKIVGFAYGLVLLTIAVAWAIPLHAEPLSAMAPGSDNYLWWIGGVGAVLAAVYLYQRFHKKAQPATGPMLNVSISPATSVSPPAAPPPVTPPPTYTQTTTTMPNPSAAATPLLEARYANRDDLMKDLGARDFPYAVMLDNETVHTGFGPALAYFTWPDGHLDWLNPKAAPPTMVTVDPAAEAAKVLAAAAAPPAVGEQPAAPVAEWPKLVEFKGVRFMLDAPLADQYEPSTMARIMGSQGQQFVADPSNGKKCHQPTRSAMGFPLFYAIAGDGSVVGTPSVVYRDQTFNSDAEVVEYLRRLSTPAE